MPQNTFHCDGLQRENPLRASLLPNFHRVKSHVQSLFRKLNVLSRTEAIAVANRRGLLRL